MQRPLAAALALVLGLAVTAVSCGGGGGLSIGGGIDGSAVVSGPIQGFGSIFVRGIEFDTTDAMITIDGQAASESDLRLGMVVTVEGDIDGNATTGTALAVNFQEEVRGPVDSVDNGASMFTVLSQVVVVDAATVFEGATLGTLMAGDFVEVSGFRDSGDRILATRVEVEDGGSEDIDVQGPVKNLNTVARTFAIGSQAIDYSGATISGGTLANGLLVEVKGRTPLVAGVLVATEIDIEDESAGDEGDEAEKEGIVTALLSATSFRIGTSTVVRFDSGTRFDGGTEADLALDVKLSARGTFAGDGAIEADRIELELEDDD